MGKGGLTKGACNTDVIVVGWGGGQRQCSRILTYLKNFTDLEMALKFMKTFVTTYFKENMPKLVDL